MKLCVIPIDNRPVCYSLVKDIVSIDETIELYMPPRELLGGLTKDADLPALLKWLEACPKTDIIVLALDTVAYGGLIPSRRSKEIFEEIKTRVERLKQILQEKDAKIYAFSSIMRISNNNYNEEEKEYWKDYGKKIFEYSFSEGKCNADIPREILEDYLATRRRNFEINKLYLSWQKEGLFDTLIFSKDDCAEKGLNVEEAKELENLGGKTKTGADEIPLSLLSRAIKKEINVFVEFTEPKYKHLVSNYEDVSIEESVLGQLDLGGFKVVQDINFADVVLIVNNFIEKQGEHVMGWSTKEFDGFLKLPSIPYVIADVRFANGADNSFVEHILEQIDLKNFYGYSAWNTSANTLGSLLAGLKVRYLAEKYDERAYKKLQMIRFLDDWAYQSNVRKLIDAPSDIVEFMLPFEYRVSKVLGNFEKNGINYSFPWDRKFEVEVDIF